MFYLSLSCASTNKMCPKVSEKPKRVWGHSKNFLYKLVAIASSLHSISAYQRYSRNSSLLLDNGDNLCFFFGTI